jgi:hypothetical protein
MSKTGLSLCALYALVIAVCIGFVFLGGPDPKGRYMFLQIPIVFQSALIVSLGLAKFCENLSWPAAYLLLASPAFVLLYGLGAFIDRMRHLNKGNISN